MSRFWARAGVNRLGPLPDANRLDDRTEAAVMARRGRARCRAVMRHSAVGSARARCRAPRNIRSTLDHQFGCPALLGWELWRRGRCRGWCGPLEVPTRSSRHGLQNGSGCRSGRGQWSRPCPGRSCWPSPASRARTIACSRSAIWSLAKMLDTLAGLQGERDPSRPEAGDASTSPTRRHRRQPEPPVAPTRLLRCRPRTSRPPSNIANAADTTACVLDMIELFMDPS